MFLELDKKPAKTIAALDDGGAVITYGELVSFIQVFGSVTGSRKLMFILSGNCTGAMAGYVAALGTRTVPLLLSEKINRDLLDHLLATYQPAYLWVDAGKEAEFGFPVLLDYHGYCLLKTNWDTFPLYKDLSLLLPTSGSTGSPKLVRHSYSNVEQNARNVAAFFELNPDHTAVAMLPMHYTMGLSVVSSHLYAGSRLLLMKSNLTDKLFWDFIKENQATSFTGVPYSYEVLYKLRFFRMNLPHLTLITQGGGKLREGLFKEYAEFAEKAGKKFIATYGQTEGTARMAYLPAEWATKKTGSIGHAVPGGKLSLVDEHNRIIPEMEAEGQMVYEGPNVTLGYALSRKDLLKGDENQGVLYTGDIARRDSDGCYYIIGRMKRFLKLYGLRVSLDEVEQMVKSSFDTDCVCSGNDEKMIVSITNPEIHLSVLDHLVEKTGLFHQAIEIRHVEEIKKNEAGKPVF